MAGPRCALRAAIAADAFALASTLDDADAATLARLPFSGTLRAARAALERLLAAEGCTYVATVDDYIIGYASLRPRVEDAVHEIAFAVAAEWRGQRYGTEICALLIHAAETSGRCRRLAARTYVANVAAQRLLRASGFSAMPARSRGVLEFGREITPAGAASA